MKSTYDVELEDECDDATYLKELSKWVPHLFHLHEPGVVFFQSGVDALKEDKFGRLALTREGLLRRNNIVYSACIAAGIPLVITMGGGYSNPIDLPRQQQCHFSSATSAVPHQQQCHVSNIATSAVPCQQQCHISNSATSATVPCQQYHVNSATVPRQQCPATMTGSVMGMPGQLANESIAEYRQRFKTQLALIAAEEQRQLAAEAVRLQAEAAATAEKQRLQAEADADTQARRKEAQDLLQRHEATSIEKLKFWHFEPTEEHDDTTPE
ncbi:hypothetical protein CBR_g37706 [Chara braunii]|uniref:Histone deacetylase domain-containing protein n=1 Tax=Chara braunii TaxID=69332 RepID=A0A388JZW7_CHABU|nr:hypothetical protein CBR_g37706 [Chara braunii]|eukprot:GBG63349.1 hypothetical protein CBR_g37706 [Chara braunii]